MENYEPLSESESKIFNIKEIHKRYWKKFCDRFYKNFRFPEGTDWDYEKKFEYFCNSKIQGDEHSNYAQRFLQVNSDELKQLKECSEEFLKQKDGYDIVPELFIFVSKMKRLSAKLENDSRIISLVCPYRRDERIDYTKYLITEKSSFLPKSKDWPTIRETIKSEACDKMLWEMMDSDSYSQYTNDMMITDDFEGNVIPFNPTDENIAFVVDEIFENQVYWYNESLKRYMRVCPTKGKGSEGNELMALLYRLFVSYRDSLKDIKDILDESPSPLKLVELQKERNHQIRHFGYNDYGKHWMACVTHENGIQNVAKYFIHHRDHFTDYNERDFFYTLDKICIIDDILQGNADKYGLNISYPDDWMKPSREAAENEKKTSKAQQVAKQNIIPVFVYEKIKSFQEGKTKPRDFMLPVRAAVEAGLMSRLTFEDYGATGLMNNQCESTYYDYLKEDKIIYKIKEYQRILKDFKQLSNNDK
uniref:hypothetical protein n=1 Tax=Prevotella sp. TaxID=59823 RepID=UPI004024F3A4